MALPPPKRVEMGAFYRVFERSELSATRGYTTERLNLDIRQRVAAIGRRVNTLCQGETGLRGASAGPVSGLSQLRVASRQFAPAVAAPRSHQRLWLGENVAAVHTGNGGRVDGSRVVAQSSAPLPGAAVAASSSAVTRSPEEDVDQPSYCLSDKPARRDERAAENLFRGLMTG